MAHEKPPETGRHPVLEWLRRHRKVYAGLIVFLTLTGSLDTAGVVYLLEHLL